MFIGHFAVGLAAKRLAPRASLPVLLAAPQVLDILWPVLVATGIERAAISPGITAVYPLDLASMPWSHSLAAALVWSALAGVAYDRATRDRRAALVVAACVVSHWVLDWVTHGPDMPLYPGGARYGLGLWNSVSGTLAVEGSLFAYGVWTYATVTRAKTRGGATSWWSLVAFLAAAYVASVFGPAPPSVGALVAVAFAAIAVVLGWASAIERRRESVA